MLEPEWQKVADRILGWLTETLSFLALFWLEFGQDFKHN